MSLRARPLPLLALLAALALGSGWSAVSQATTMVELSDTDLTWTADVVVRGVVLQTRSEWTEHDSLYTLTSIEVADVLKGEALSGDQIHVREAGGVDGGIRAALPSAARFSEGEEVLVFLEDRGDGTFRTVGMRQGRFTVLRPADDVPIVVRPIHHDEEDYDHRQLHITPYAHTRPLLDFMSDVRRIVMTDAIPDVLLPGLPATKQRQWRDARIARGLSIPETLPADLEGGAR